MKGKTEANKLTEIDLSSKEKDSKSKSSTEADEENKESIVNEEKQKAKDLSGEDEKEEKDDKNAEKSKNNDSFVFLFDEGEIRDLAKDKLNILLRHIGKWQTKLTSVQ
eukprot:1174259-Ditylum_brightwellii.AAC.1